MALSFNKESFKRSLLHVSLAGAAVTIPLFNNLNSIALIVFVIACLLQRPVAHSLKKLSASRLWVFPAAYFLLLCCSYFWDTSGGFSIKDLERYAALFFIPMAMALAPRMATKQLKTLCWMFAGVTILISLICLAKAYAEYQNSGDYRVFYYHYLGGQMGLNAIFLSNYCLASISWILFFGFIRREKHTARQYFLMTLCVIFLFFMIFLLSSKLVIFLLLVMLTIFILYLGYLHGFLLRAVLFILVIIITGMVSINSLSYLKWRLNVTELKQYEGRQDDNNGLAIRLLMWKTAADLIGERPILGYGIRGAREKTLERYKEQDFMLGYEQGYHSHNQYLESALMLGLPGLGLLLAMIFRAGWRSFRSRNFLAILMLAHFICQSVIESNFEVQQELVFFLFFIFLFYYHQPSARNIK